jgi:hypothetical protein
METLITEKWMEEEFLNGRMAVYTKEIIRIIKNTDLESTLIKKEKLMKADGKTDIGKARASSSTNLDNPSKANGTSANSTETSPANYL